MVKNVKNVSGILMGIALTPQITFVNGVLSTILTCLNHEHRIYFLSFVASISFIGVL